MTNDDLTDDQREIAADAERRAKFLEEFENRRKLAKAFAKVHGILLPKGRPGGAWVRFDGRVLKTLREGLPARLRSQTAFSKALDVSMDTVCNWEKKHRARIADFKRIIALLRQHYPAVNVQAQLLGIPK